MAALLKGRRQGPHKKNVSGQIWSPGFVVDTCAVKSLGRGNAQQATRQEGKRKTPPGLVSRASPRTQDRI
ncbi:hypothetical protein EYF80_026154 [Liparis tanakae]|uniref:Uncharacterized protein n=1 Tax=Liparis tanakae TaxID=230148 RepID=A0A4Z2HCM1_9TELE|nr:hypothetical protein EYF80_026154 [Liparis tanakae]